MATKLSPAMIAMIVEASHFRHHEIIGGNSRTLQAVIDRGLATVKVNTTGGANTVHLTPTGYDTAVTHRPAVEPVEDIVTVAEVVNQADTLAEVAEAARREHFANATSEDINRAFCESPTYKASHAALMAAIVAAYPDTDAEAVYDVWVDCNESIAYCANWVREQAITDAADAARMAAEDAADAAADTARDAATLNLSNDYRRFLTGREGEPRTALALAHAHTTLNITLTPQDGDELSGFPYTLPTEVYGVPVERVVRAVFGDVNVYDDGVLLCGVARHFTDAGARRAVAILARRIMPDVMAEVDAQNADDMEDMVTYRAEHAQDTAPILHTGDRAISDGWEERGEITWTREIRNVWYAFTMVRLPDGRIRTTATREDYYGTDELTREAVLVDRERLHTFITGEVAPVPLVGPRSPVSRDDSSGNGAILWWDRTIAGQSYRFVLGVNTDNAAVVATVSALGTGKRIRVIPFRKPATVAVVAQPPVITTAPRAAKTTIHIGTWRDSCASHGCPGCVAPRATQPPVVTLPPRTVATGKRSVPRKGRGRRSSGWRKAGKGGK